MEHCLIRNSRGVCMCVSGEGSAVTAKMCKFVEGAAGGILFENGGGGFVSECDIASNRQFGVLVTNGSEPVISSCMIHDGGAEGIVFFEAGGLVSDCDVYKNTGVGICITQESDPRVEQCRLFRGRSCGLLVQVLDALRPLISARPLFALYIASPLYCFSRPPFATPQHQLFLSVSTTQAFDAELGWRAGWR